MPNGRTPAGSRRVSPESRSTTVMPSQNPSRVNPPVTYAVRPSFETATFSWGPFSGMTRSRPSGLRTVSEGVRPR